MRALGLACLFTVAVAAQNPTGPQNVVAIPVNTVTRPSQPLSVAQIQATFAVGSPFLQHMTDSSYEKIGPWTATVMNYQTYNDSANPLNPCQGGYGTLMFYGTTQAQAAYPGVTFSRRYVFLPDCSGIINGISATGGAVSVFAQSNVRTLVHETGHNWGLSHSLQQMRSCCDGNFVSDGDRYTSMLAYGLPVATQYGVEDKRKLGWLDAGGPRTLTVTTSGDYALEPYEHPLTPQGIVALRVPPAAGTNLWFIVEARVDGDGEGGSPGVILHSAVQFNPTQNILLDTDPIARETQAVLQVGQSYTFAAVPETTPVTPVNVTTLAFGPTGAVVHVAFPNSTPSPPLPVSNVRVQ